MTPAAPARPVLSALQEPTLGARVRRAGRPHQLRMLGLLAPSVLFLSVFFVAPIGLFLYRSVDNSEVPGWLPRTVTSLGAWDGDGLPPEAAYRALAEDLRALAGSHALALLGRRLNHAIPGFRGLIIGTANRVEMDGPGSAREALVALDPRWDEPAYWQAIRRERHRLTAFYLLSALDLRQRADGSLERVSAESAVFLDLLGRTLQISLTVTLLCLLIAFPVAATMAGSAPPVANILLILVLIPFWTSLLVRSAAWVILLQNQGLVNQTLLGLGLLDRPVPLIFNRLGLYIAMVHVLLPFMILPLFSVLRGIPPELMRAAASLGAAPLAAFWRVYVPQALPGVVAGASLVFVLALGYYITPALVGGPGDQMIGYFIAYFTNTAVNWSMAAALGTLLLAVVVVIYLALGRIVGLDRLAVR